MDSLWMDVLGNLSKVSVIDISHVMGLIFAGVMIDALQLTMSITIIMSGSTQKQS